MLFVTKSDIFLDRTFFFSDKIYSSPSLIILSGSCTSFRHSKSCCNALFISDNLLFFISNSSYFFVQFCSTVVASDKPGDWSILYLSFSLLPDIFCPSILTCVLSKSVLLFCLVFLIIFVLFSFVILTFVFSSTN